MENGELNKIFLQEYPIYEPKESESKEVICTYDIEGNKLIQDSEFFEDDGNIINQCT